MPAAEPLIADELGMTQRVTEFQGAFSRSSCALQKQRVSIDLRVTFKACCAICICPKDGVEWALGPAYVGASHLHMALHLEEIDSHVLGN